ncbi:MAG TPA: SWIM zinc finger family protein [Tepidisphaeraceae bacterium]|jgi:uncharacterized Zn finger protein
MSWYGFKPYVSVAKRQANAKTECEKLKKKGQTITPVECSKKIAETFWGEAWCDNLEAYSDFENRLPRGRSYVRNGSVVHLEIGRGKVSALVSGSELYKINISIKPLAAAAWKAIREQCAGQIGSVIELLQGKLSGAVMQIITRRPGGLFPTPAEISLDCSCPDWADMCKHVAAALYGVGARLDQQPELLFTLRNVEHMDLIGAAGDVKALTRGGGAKHTIAAGDIGDVFGIELEAADVAAAAVPAPVSPAAVVAKRRGKAKKAANSRRTKPAGKTEEKVASKAKSKHARKTIRE